MKPIPKPLHAAFDWFSLLAVALLCGLIWRWEVDQHGWEGLIWLGYFHKAIPVGFLLCLIWSNLMVRLRWDQRVLVNTIAVLFGGLTYYLLARSLAFQHVTGPSAMMFFGMPAWKMLLLQNLSRVLIPLMPVGVYAILRLFGKQVQIWWLIVAMGCMAISSTVAEFLLMAVDHRGGFDFIHAIKSGFLAPLWVFSTGLVLVGHAKAARKADHWGRNSELGSQVPAQQ